VTPPRNDLSAPVRATTPWTGPGSWPLSLESGTLWVRIGTRGRLAHATQILTRREAPSVRVVEATDADLAAIRAAGYSVTDAREGR
jgi:hypothetical protein